MPFDPAWLDLPDESPLSALGLDVTAGAGGVSVVTELGDGFWATTGEPEEDGSPVEVTAIWWACSADAMRTLVESADPPTDGADPPAVLGYPDARFGVLREQTGPRITCLYRSKDGLTIATLVMRAGRKVYYAGGTPTDDALPMAICMSLRG